MIASLDADTVSAALERLDLPPDVRRVLELRQLTASASVKKLYAMEHRASRDNRLRDLIIHHGTHPGRPTGGGVQPLNLPKAGPQLALCVKCERPARPVPFCPWCGALNRADRRTSWSVEMVPFVLEIMATRDLSLVERFFGDALLAISGCVRSLFVAADGHDLIGSDYSSLQAVVLAMLAGEQWRIDAFRNREPLYLLGASKITGIPVAEYLAYHAAHGEHHPDRQKIGKVSELACLAGDTRVYALGPGRMARWVPIVELTTRDQVYDGWEWVNHAGVVPRGHQMVYSAHGIRATHDHLFWDGGRWVQFSQMGLMLTSEGVEPVYDIAQAGPRNRFTIHSARGHIIAHNCGFQGWIGSYRAFGSEEPDDVIRKQILAWREASPAIVEFWGGQWRGPPWRRERPELFGMEGTFIGALQTPGVTMTFRGMPFRYDQARDVLTIGLLSGLRSLTYHAPRLAQSERNADELSISYSGFNSNPTRGAPGWQRISTYGGSLTENVVMAHEVEIQRHAMRGLTAAGYPLVLEVYDELIAEIPEGWGSLEKFERIMSIMPAWAADWPCVAEGGWIGKRYRKG